MTEYERELIACLKQPHKWPNFERARFLARLDDLAERALKKRSVEGKLAAILIYHQLAEEVLKLLVQDGQFLVRVALRPWRIDFPARHKQMFGQLQEELRRSVGFREKDQLLALAEEINTLRIDVVHRLTKRPSLKGLAREGRKAKGLYDRIFRMFGDAHYQFTQALHGFRKELDEDDLP